MTRALITGFEPFGPNPVNPTQALVELLQTKYSASTLEAQLLPVTFTGARGRIQALIEAKRPQIVLSCGLYAAARQLHVERIAVNEQEGQDNSGFSPTRSAVDPADADGLFATIDTAALLGKLKNAGFDAAISWHAGTYVCNTTLYSAIQATKTYGAKAGFLHVPTDVDVPKLAATLAAWVEEN